MSPLFDAVLIDLDGTLLDTAADLANAANTMLRALGRAERSTAQLTNYIGKGIPRIVHRTLTGDMNADAEPALFTRALSLYESAYASGSGQTAQRYDGVVAGLERFCAGGIKRACVTNKSRRHTVALLDRTDLSRHFEIVICGDDLAERKPHPLPYISAAARLGVLPARALVIGDSINDVRAGRAAGCIVFAVPYGYREGESVESLGADRIVDSLDTAARITLGAP